MAPDIPGPSVGLQCMHSITEKAASKVSFRYLKEAMSTSVDKCNNDHSCAVHEFRTDLMQQQQLARMCICQSNLPKYQYHINLEVAESVVAVPKQAHCCISSPFAWVCFFSKTTQCSSGCLMSCRQALPTGAEIDKSLQEHGGWLMANSADVTLIILSYLTYQSISTTNPKATKQVKLINPQNNSSQY